jgi:aspartyl/glutamyl-tRNA(Asn/Gln) amidotransferase C subunit
MATTEEVKKLAALARITIADSDLEKFTSEFEAILTYVGQLEKLDLPVDLTSKKSPLHNAMRGDGEPHATGFFTEKLAKQFPAREGDMLVVKQIVSHD